MDFETTAPTDNSFDPKQNKMFVVFYVIVFSFHPKLNLDRLVVQRSFACSFKKLTTIDYLTNGQMECINSKLVSQLKDYAICVNQKCLSSDVLC